MANVFDQFDQQQATGGNPFDQFDNNVTLTAPKGAFNIVPSGAMQSQPGITINGQTPDINQAVASFPNQASIPSGFDKYNAVERGMGNAVLGLTQLANTGNQNIDQNLLAQTIANSNEAGKGTGVGGAIGEMAGDPRNWMLGLVPAAQMASAPIRAAAGAAYGLTQGSESPDMKGQLKDRAINSVANSALFTGLPIAIDKAAPIVSDIGKSIKLNYDMSPLASEAGGGFSVGNSPSVDASTLKSLAGQNYDAMKEAGADFNRTGINKITYNIGKDLADSGLMNDKLHGQTMSVVNQLNDDAATGNMSLEKLDQYRQLLGDVISNNTKSKIDGGGLNTDGMKAQTALHALDDAVGSLDKGDISNPDAVDLLNRGRELWSAGSKVQRVENIIENSKLENNPTQYIRTQMKQWAKDPRGLTDDEIADVMKASKTGLITGALRTMGGKIASGLIGTVSGAAGGGLPGGIAGGAAGEAIGFPLRALANARQTSRAVDVINTIANRPEIQNTLRNLTPEEIAKLPPGEGKAILERTIIRKVK